MDWAIFVTGYREAALEQLAQAELGLRQLQEHGAAGIVETIYRFDYSLAHHEIDKEPAHGHRP